MIYDFTERTEQVIGAEAAARLSRCRVAVFGIGGVGGHACEALARAGIGALDLIDSDVVERSNLNRQLVALRSTVGLPKVRVMAERIADINPDCKVRAHELLYLPETAGLFDFSEYDYLIDAVDNVTAKLDLVQRAQEAGVPIISSMGAGNKVRPECFEIADLYETSVDPLAKVMRRECKARGIKSLKVVYSKEQPKSSGSTPGSVSWVPGVAGMILASVAIRDLTEKTDAVMSSAENGEE